MKTLRKILSFTKSLFTASRKSPPQLESKAANTAPSSPPRATIETDDAKPPKQVVFRRRPAFGGFNWGPLVAIPRKSNGRLKTVLFETRNHKFLSAKVRGVEGPNVVISRHGSRPFKRRLVPA